MSVDELLHALFGWADDAYSDADLREAVALYRRRRDGRTG